MFYTIYVFWLLVQLGYLDPERCYEDTRPWVYDPTVQMAGYTCPVQPIRSRQR